MLRRRLAMLPAGLYLRVWRCRGRAELRPEGGGRDVFFHISRLSEGQATDLVPGTKVAYALGMDRTGKMAAATVRILPAESAPKEPAKS